MLESILFVHDSNARAPKQLKSLLMYSSLPGYIYTKDVKFEPIYLGQKSWHFLGSLLCVCACVCVCVCVCVCM